MFGDIWTSVLTTEIKCINAYGLICFAQRNNRRPFLVSLKLRPSDNNSNISSSSGGDDNDDDDNDDDDNDDNDNNNNEHNNNDNHYNDD